MGMQVFYDEFGRLMMDQPLIGFNFTTYAPAALVPYVLLLLNVFNRLAAVFVRSKRWEFSEDWAEDAASQAAARRLLLELENSDAGPPIGLSIDSPRRRPSSGHWRMYQHICSTSVNLFPSSEYPRCPCLLPCDAACVPSYATGDIEDRTVCADGCYAVPVRRVMH